MLNPAGSTDSTVVRAWYGQIAEASKTPALAQYLVRRTGELFPRFASFFDKLRALPRRLRRALGRKRGFSLAGVAMLLALNGTPLHAGTLVVDEICSLGNAITAANTDFGTYGCPNGAGDDLILLNAEVTLDGPLPAITSTLTIRAGSHSIVDGDGHACFEVESFSGAHVVLDGLTVRNCIAQYGGGGIYNGGTLTVSSCTISGNESRSGGGGIISVGTLTIDGSTISGNATDGEGGGVWNRGSSLTIVDSVISGNSAEDGGGIYNTSRPLKLVRTVITGNEARFDGGGILIHSYLTPDVTIVDSLISANTAGYMGGGIASDAAWTGGAVITIHASTISGNAAKVGGGFASRPYDFNTVRMEQSTVSGNTATSRGGGIYQVSSCNDQYKDNLSLVNVTVSNNSSGTEGGGIYMGCPEISLSHSLITGNSAPLAPEMALDQSDRVTVNGFNVVGYDGDARSSGFSPGPTDIVPAAGVQVADILAPLAYDGGPTPTHALVPGSPALDAIPTSDPNCVGTTDQRGFPRPEGAGCDTGSVEVALSAPFGGSAVGFAPERVGCLNKTTGERKQSGFSGPTWSCEALGLTVSTGDAAHTTASGVAASPAIGGSVTRMTPSLVTCTNETTGQKVKSNTNATSWDCEALGLVVAPGDTVTTGATGTID